VVYGQAGLDGYFVVRRSYGGYAVVVAAAAAAVVVGMAVAVAVVVMIHQRPMLVGDEGARSMDLVVSEGGQRKGLDRRLTATEEEHADEIGGFEA
jgi:ribosomal protein S18 acetylase RimI-like enzyme